MTKPTTSKPTHECCSGLDPQFTDEFSKYMDLDVHNDIAPTYGDLGSQCHYFETEVQRKVVKFIPDSHAYIFVRWGFYFFKAMEEYHCKNLKSTRTMQTIAAYIKENLFRHGVAQLQTTGRCASEREEMERHEAYIINAIVAETLVGMQGASFILKD